MKHIRNICIISHVDHGKTTMSDHLLGYGGMLPEKLMGKVRALDELEEEQERGITIESSIASLNVAFGEIKYKLNLIDTPGHVDFSGKVAEALRLVDGALVLVDAVEGVMAQTSTVLRQAMKEFIVPILVVNKMDRLILELELTEKQILKRIELIIAEVANICKSYGIEKKHIPNFSKGTVLLISAYNGWGIDFSAIKEKSLTMGKIINFHINSKVQELSNIAPLGEMLITAIYKLLPNPKQAQIFKFPRLIKIPNPVNEKVLSIIHSMDKSAEAIIIVGKHEQYGKQTRYGSVIRMLSGTLRKNSTIYSNLLNQKVKITRMYNFQGKSTKDKAFLEAGEIGLISTSPSIIPGDILTSNQETKLKANDVGYVQEPVVFVTIEPKKVREITKIQNVLETKSQSVPGLNFLMDTDTGELKLLGVGKLQLDVFISELKKDGYEIESSDPLIIKFDMPTLHSKFKFEKVSGYNVEVGKSEEINLIATKKLLYEDAYNNQFYLGRNFSFSSESIHGMTEIFRQSVRVSPTTGENIRNLTILLSETDKAIPIKTYEDGIITMSALMRESINHSQTKTHEPFHILEISIPETYLGAMVQELQKIDAKIESIETHNNLNIIVAELHLNESVKMTDNFRQISDGNAFWSYKRVIYKPSTN